MFPFIMVQYVHVTVHTSVVIAFTQYIVELKFMWSYDKVKVLLGHTTDEPATKHRKLPLLSLYQAGGVLVSVAGQMSMMVGNRQLQLVSIS